MIFVVNIVSYLAKKRCEIYLGLFVEQGSLDTNIWLSSCPFDGLHVPDNMDTSMKKALNFGLLHNQANEEAPSHVPSTWTTFDCKSY